ncbi:MAG: hypothetical protein H7319_22760 [Spirosoma sp.]|nr:hypothetical protein [Spirosoma sp.]
MITPSSVPSPGSLPVRPLRPVEGGYDTSAVPDDELLIRRSFESDTYQG